MLGSSSIVCYASGLARFGRWFAHLGVVSGVFVGIFFAHELGHALVALALGARIVAFNVLGIQWYPILAWIPQNGFGGYVVWYASPNLIVHRLIVMAGSMSTLLIALGAALALHRFAMRGLARTALIAFSFYFLVSPPMTCLSMV